MTLIGDATCSHHTHVTIAITGFELDDRERGIIDSLGRTDLRIVTKELMPGAPEWY